MADREAAGQSSDSILAELRGAVARLAMLREDVQAQRLSIQLLMSNSLLQQFQKTRATNNAHDGICRLLSEQMQYIHTLAQENSDLKKKLVDQHSIIELIIQKNDEHVRRVAAEKDAEISRLVARLDREAADTADLRSSLRQTTELLEKTVQVMHLAADEEDKQHLEFQAVNASLLTENNGLRQMLGLDTADDDYDGSAAAAAAVAASAATTSGATAATSSGAAVRSTARAVGGSPSRPSKHSPAGGNTNTVASNSDGDPKETSKQIAAAAMAVGPFGPQHRFPRSDDDDSSSSSDSNTSSASGGSSIGGDNGGGDQEAEEDDDKIVVFDANDDRDKHRQMMTDDPTGGSIDIDDDDNAASQPQHHQQQQQQQQYHQQHEQQFYQQQQQHEEQQQNDNPDGDNDELETEEEKAKQLILDSWQD